MTIALIILALACAWFWLRSRWYKWQRNNLRKAYKELELAQRRILRDWHKTREELCAARGKAAIHELEREDWQELFDE